MMVWRLLSFWDDLFSGAMLNFQRVIDIYYIFLYKIVIARYQSESVDDSLVQVKSGSSSHEIGTNWSITGMIWAIKVHQLEIHGLSSLADMINVTELTQRKAVELDLNHS